MKPPPDRLEKVLGHGFAQPRLLAQALRHSSTTRGPEERTLSNQRMEFLGDRVLGMVAAQFLYERFPGEEEGYLARRHAALVRREALARVAEGIGLARHLVISKSEEEAGGRANPGLLADAMEAVIAALYLDGGMEAAAAFIRRHWTELMEEDTLPPQDAKTALQEWAQGRGLDLPLYREIGRQGPPHAPTFVIEVAVEGAEPIEARGSSKRAAEQEAARAMLDRLRKGPGNGR